MGDCECGMLGFGPAGFRGKQRLEGFEVGAEVVIALGEVFDDYFPVEGAVPFQFGDDLELIELPLGELFAHVFVERGNRGNVSSEGDEDEAVPNLATKCSQADVLAAEVG